MRKGRPRRPNPRETAWVPLTAVDRAALEQLTTRVEVLTRFVRRSLLDDMVPREPRRPRPTR